MWRTLSACRVETPPRDLQTRNVEAPAGVARYAASPARKRGALEFGHL